MLSGNWKIKSELSKKLQERRKSLPQILILKYLI